MNRREQKSVLRRYRQERYLMNPTEEKSPWRRLVSFLSGLFEPLPDDLQGDKVLGEPIIQDFPNLWVDGQVSIDCIIRAAAGADLKNAFLQQQADSGVIGIASHCVGAVVVEINEYGLGLWWVPAQLADKSFLSPFGRTPAAPGAAEPAEDRGHDRHE
jgi:hypothetical protein